MKNYQMFGILAAAALFAAVGPGAAFLAAPLDLKMHAGEAEVICVGSTTIVRQGPPDEKAMVDITAALHVDRMIKGDLQPGYDIRINYRQQTMYPRQRLTGYDLVLLKKGEDGYVFARDAFSTMPVSRQTHTLYRQGTDVTANLRWEVLNSLRDESLPVLRAALEQTRILSVQDIQSHIKPLAMHPDVGIRALAISACIGAGDDSLVPEAIDTVTAQLASEKKVNPPGILELQAALELGGVQAAHIPLLVPPLASESVAVREFAVCVLRQSRDRAAVPLLKSALYDSEIRIRYNAVMGLASFTGRKDYAPAYAKYQSDEKTYLDYWKSYDFE